MSLNDVPTGKNAPDDVNVIIEIPMNSDPIKYEIDKDSGAVFVDRMLGTAMHYPCNVLRLFQSAPHYKDIRRGIKCYRSPFAKRLADRATELGKESESSMRIMWACTSRYVMSRNSTTTSLW